MVADFGQKNGLPVWASRIVESKCLRLFVTAVEFIDPARRIDEFLLAGEERMALGADADFHFRTRGFDVPNFAAGTGNDGVTVLGMDIFFHFLFPQCLWLIFNAKT